MLSAVRLTHHGLRGVRWWILGLIVGGHFLNYVDRQTISLLAPLMGRELGWSELGYGRIVMAFQLSYAISMLFGGFLIDRIGTRRGVGVAVALWSVAQIAHVLPRTAVGFGMARIGLAAGEATGFVGLVKAMNLWFSNRERGVAAGIVLSSVQVSAMIGPLIIPLLAARWGWQSAFAVTGVAGIAFVIPWFIFYHVPGKHPRVSASELAFIQDGKEDQSRQARAPLAEVLRTPQVWAYTAAVALTQPAWSFISYWFPKFLFSVFHLSGTGATKYLMVSAAMSATGALGGGLGSSLLIKKGMTAPTARKTLMLFTAIVMPFVIFAGVIHSPWAATLLVGLGSAGFHCWATNNMALVGDIMPTRALGSALGIGNFIASIAGVLSAEATGRVLTANPQFYLPMFIYTGTIFPIALVITHLLTRPRS